MRSAYICYVEKMRENHVALDLEENKDWTLLLNLAMKSKEGRVKFLPHWSYGIPKGFYKDPVGWVRSNDPFDGGANVVEEDA